jgi:hypothetical protein
MRFILYDNKSRAIDQKFLNKLILIEIIEQSGLGRGEEQTTLVVGQRIHTERN